MKRGIGTIVAVALGILGGAVAQSAFAQASCNGYPGGSTPPSGYGASWNVFAPETQPLLVKSDCASGNQLKITVGGGYPAQYVYEKGYAYYAVYGWQPFTLSGTQREGVWFVGDASVTIPKLSTSPLFYVGFVCLNRTGGWKCGCRDQACTTPSWQLQSYTTKPPIEGSGPADCSGGPTGPSGNVITENGAVVKGRAYQGTVTIAADNVTFACNRITGGAPAISVSAQGAKILNNEINASLGGIYLENRNATNAEIGYNYLHGALEKKVGIYVGSGRGTHEVRMNANVHHNLIDDWESHNCIEIKSSSNTIAFNTLIGTGESCTINNRHGWDNSFIANWVEHGGVNASDYRTRVIGNVLKNSSGHGSGLNAKAGNVHPEDYTDVPDQYVSAKDTLFVGNDADEFTIGWRENGNETLPARDITVEANKGVDPILQLVVGVTIRQTTSATVPQASKLTPLQVGPNHQ